VNFHRFFSGGPTIANETAMGPTTGHEVFVMIPSRGLSGDDVADVDDTALNPVTGQKILLYITLMRFPALMSRVLMTAAWHWKDHHAKEPDRGLYNIPCAWWRS
jgi:hypothetical protein